MPKEVLAIDEFYGGQDSNTDPRDIAFEDSVKIENLEVSENLDTDKRGKVKTSGQFKDATTAISCVDAYLDNKLLQATFVYGSDYNFINPVTGDEQAVDAAIQYLKPTLIPIVGTFGKIHIYDSFYGDVGNFAALDFAYQLDNTNELDPIYYNADGALVVSNRNFNNSVQEPLMIKLIKRTIMQHTEYEQFVKQWYMGPAKSVAPPDDILNFGGNQSSPDPGRISIGFTSNNGGPIQDSLKVTWEFGTSYMIDDFEESDIVPDSSGYIHDMVDVDSENSPSIDISLDCNDIVNDFGLRVTGIRIYMKITGSEDWYILSTIDFKKSTSYTPTWGAYRMDLYDAGNGIFWVGDEGGVSPYFSYLPLETYMFFAGREALDTTPIVYKTAVVSGKRTWIGNIKKDGIIYGDRIMKSAVRQYNVFPEENWIDVVTDDGDEIIKLEAFADRILQFKRNTLYIINAPSQGGEFLEAQYPGYGITYPSASTLTPNGVVFANSQGLFLYDSEKVSNLLVSGQVTKVSKEEWYDFTIEEGEFGAVFDRALKVGYEPDSECIHIYNGDGVGSGYKVSLINQAISTLQNPETVNFSSNFFTFKNKMYHLNNVDVSGNSVVVQSWDKNPSNNRIELITRDFDLGEPSIRKKVYRVWLTYKNSYTGGADSLIRLFYSVNGEDTFRSTYDAVSGTYNNVAGYLYGTSDVWQQVWFKPQGDTVKNIYSIQFKIASIAGGQTSGFELDDISFVYRRKRAK